jgi:hypothetical protein
VKGQVRQTRSIYWRHFDATLKLFEEQYQSIKQEIDARMSK